MQIVITGDVVNSRKVNAEIWLASLKEVLNIFGKEHSDWDIYRGDSFQILLEAKVALRFAFLVKSKIKQISKLDVRLALGLGIVDFRNKRVLDSNGPAFIHSGECYDSLKKSNLKIKSDYLDLNETLNLMFSLILLVADSWKSVTSEVVYEKLLNIDLTQSELAYKLGKKSQASISEALKRGGFEEIEQLLSYFEKEIEKYVRAIH